MLRDLFGNFATVALFVAIWAASQEWSRSWPPLARSTAAGIYMGSAAVATMLMAVPFEGGVIFDLRSIVVGLAGMFGGPIAAFISAALAGTYRLWLGGPGVSAGIFSIAFGCASGLLAFHIRTKLSSSLGALVLFAITQAALPCVALGLLPVEIREHAFTSALLPLVILNVVSSLLSAVIIEQSRRRGWLVHLLKAAIKQAPDYFYIKDRDSKIILANEGVVSAAGFRHADDLLGKTDFDFTDDIRARQLMLEEADILATGKPIRDREERLLVDGRLKTFVTTKSAIRNEDGTIAGLIGVTKDMTERFALEARLRATQDELDKVLNGMSDGIARFDGENRLVFANSNYVQLFPLTGHIRQPGVLLEAILQEVLRTKEQVLDGISTETWLQTVLKNTQSGGEEHVRMMNGRWLRIRSQPLDTGGSVVIVSDVTAIKLAEQQLMNVAEQFRILATVDPLTGLRNRRDFDEGLEREFGRAAASGAPLSLVLADIDYFKLYNDTYGHPAGDAVLRRVAEAIGMVCGRRSDMAARYGGEEFAVILPNTDKAGAALIASKLVSGVDQLRIAHRTSPAGQLSISVGVATLEGANSDFANAASLLAAADEALYHAKKSGRGRFAAA